MRRFGSKKPLHQTDTETWRAMWQSLLPPENRNVEITCDGESMTAFLQVNHVVIMLQDGLLMKEGFFAVCDFFRKAGYHVIWLMRCKQDIHNHYLKKLRTEGRRTRWLWRRPTTNFGRWTSDNFGATILLQPEELDGDTLDLSQNVLQRVVWAESDEAGKMIPSRTVFYTDNTPGTPSELLSWIRGANLGSVREK